jgi:hypothetical protein
MVAFGSSIGFWTITMVWLRVVGIALTSTISLIIFLMGWIVYLVGSRYRSKNQISLKSLFINPWRLILWSGVILYVVLGLWTLRTVVVGLGSDSFHHTLITQLIVEQGQIPHNLLPLVPIESLTYHFGFHSLASVFVWLTGIPDRLVIPILGQFLMGISALSIAFFSKQITNSHKASAVSGLITSFMSVFPFFMLNWGRNTQLLGLVILPVFLGLFISWYREEYAWKRLPLIVLLATGLGFSHYRVTLMAIIGVITFILVEHIIYREGFASLGSYLFKWIVVAFGVLLLISPWVLGAFVSYQKGFGVDIGAPNQNYFSISRLGNIVLKYPTNGILLPLALISLLLGFLKRNRYVIWLYVWLFSLILMSQPSLLGELMDTISVLISSYVPVVTSIGWLIGSFFDDVLLNRPKFKRLVFGVGASFLIWGALLFPNHLLLENAYVTENDLQATKWIRKNTPETAMFLVNTFNFKFLPNYIIGSDAGYWLPVLSGRKTVTLPMIYQKERLSNPDDVLNLIEIHNLSGDLSTLHAKELLDEIGVTHVFIGERGGKLEYETLLNSTDFNLIFHVGDTSVFQYSPLRSITKR